METIQVTGKKIEDIVNSDITKKVQDGKRIIKVGKGTNPRIEGYRLINGKMYDYLILEKTAKAVNYSDSLDPDDGMEECSQLEEDLFGVEDELTSEDEHDSILTDIHEANSGAIEQYCLRSLTNPPDYNTINTETIKKYLLHTDYVKERIAKIVSTIKGNTSEAVTFPSNLEGIVEHINAKPERISVTYIVEETCGFSRVERRNKQMTVELENTSNIDTELNEIYKYQRDNNPDMPNNNEPITTTYINLVLEKNLPQNNLVSIPMPKNTPLKE